MSRNPAFLALFFFLGACAKEAPKPFQKGKGLFLTLGCRTCHKIGEQGGSGGPDLTLIGFRRSAAWLDLWLADPQAWKKDTLMPNPRLSGEARKEIVEYLASLAGQDFGGNPPWSAQAQPVKKGHLLYSRAGCVACHGVGGAGGYPNNNVAGGKIPALDLAARMYTKPELIAKIKRGVKPAKSDPAGPEPLVSMPAWGEILKDDELEAVASYLMTLGSGVPPGTDW